VPNRKEFHRWVKEKRNQPGNTKDQQNICESAQKYPQDTEQLDTNEKRAHDDERTQPTTFSHGPSLLISPATF
jgi:hypothetical protein